MIFNTTSFSYHGNPHPITHPQGIPRRSIALYYYTATWDGTKRSHTTQYRVRPRSSDLPDVEIKRREFLADVLPPFIHRKWQRFKRKSKQWFAKKGA